MVKIATDNQLINTFLQVGQQVENVTRFLYDLKRHYKYVEQVTSASGIEYNVFAPTIAQATLKARIYNDFMGGDYKSSFELNRALIEEMNPVINYDEKKRDEEEIPSPWQNYEDNRKAKKKTAGAEKL